MKKQEFKTQIGGRDLTVKIGEVARQANASCIVQYGETVVLATAVMNDQETEGMNYFPLSVEYQERFYASGKIKGSRFIKRETRPDDESILTARMIDRSIRPLFDQGNRRAVQIILTVLAFDQENDSDIPSLIATSIVLSMSDIPWKGPIGGVRIGQINNEFVLNPTCEARKESNLDLVVCGNNDKILMIEAGAKEIEDKVMYDAMEYANQHIKEITEFIQSIQKSVGKDKTDITPNKNDEKVQSEVELKQLTQEIIDQESSKYLFDHTLKTKQERKEATKALFAKLDESLIEKEIGKEKRAKAMEMAYEMVYAQVSQMILDKDQRIDGRKLDEIRPLECQAGVLPRVHGSALFSRGGTQALSVITLGSPGEEQHIDTMKEDTKKRYMHHYNFPPFSVGEARGLRSTNRREIGHGALAEKGIMPVMPNQEDFPYTVRMVSEVLSSNGSSSMASACASVLAIMDAGVPITKPVAGIAIGLASEENEKGFKRYKILTDIQDLEDGPGGMDFKVIGSKDGITAIQLDTKTMGLTMEIVKKTLEASNKARHEILDKMSKAIDQPRKEMSPYAPRIIVLKINPDKIRTVIGPGGKVINEIIDKTGVSIDIEQDGTVYLASSDKESMNKAVEWIKDITRELKVGEVFQGKVTRLMDFGAFVELVPGKEGMVHVSEMALEHVNKPSDVLKVGQITPIKLIEIDSQGRLNLSINAAKNPNYKPKPKRDTGRSSNRRFDRNHHR